MSAVNTRFLRIYYMESSTVLRLLPVPCVLCWFLPDAMMSPPGPILLFFFLSARKADLKKGFQHLVLLVLVVVLVVLVVVVGTRVKKGF
jgi:hypothetical protein